MAFQGQLLRAQCRFNVKAFIESASRSSVAAASRLQARRQLASTSSLPLASGCFTTSFSPRPTIGIWNHHTHQFARRTLVDAPKPNLPQDDEEEQTATQEKNPVHDNNDVPPIESNEKIAPPIESNEKIAMDNQEKDSSENDPASTTVPEVNVLSSLPEGYTTEQALSALNKKEGSIIHDEISDLCRSVRRGYPEDAQVLRTALRDWKHSHFVMTRLQATLMMQSMLRAMLTQDEQNKIPAALFVLQTFLDQETSGLYFAASQKNVDKVLQVLLEGCQDEGLPTVTVAEGDEQQQEEEADEDDEDGLAIERYKNSTQLVVDILYKRERKKRGARKYMKRMDKKLAAMLRQYEKEGLPLTGEPQEERDESTLQAISRRIADTTQQVINTLIKRKARPYRDMKKRAARKYLKQIRMHHGPSPKTGYLATAIFCQLRGPEAAMEFIVNPFQASQCPIKPETLELVETARLQQQQSQLEEEASAAVEEETTAPEDEEDAESSESLDASSSGYESSADECSDVDEESKEDEVDKEKE